MKNIIPASLIFLCMSSTLAAGEESYFLAKDVGKIPPKKSERYPGKALYSFANENQQATVWIITGTVDVANGGAKDHVKYFYDKSKRILVFMRRTSMPYVEDVCTWMIWHEIEPKQFMTGLPYANDEIKVTASPWKNPLSQALTNY